MSDRLSHAIADLDRARDMVSLGQRLHGLMNGILDPSDLYRAAIVQAISAMDHYFHGIVIDRAVDIILGRDNVPVASSGKISLSLHAVRDIVQSPLAVDREISARRYAAERLSRQTLQRSDEIAKALGEIGMKDVWNTAFGTDASDVRTRLGLTLTRRNRIVHQSDGDPLNPGFSTPVDDSDALASICIVVRVVRGIDAIYSMSGNACADESP